MEGYSYSDDGDDDDDGEYDDFDEGPLTCRIA